MTKTESKPSDSILFPLSELNKGIADAIPQMPTPPRWPAFQAMNHLNRAWKIREIDPEMAIFRSITAEEEAATALFLSIKRRGYDGADKLNKRKHVQKNALIPFFSAVSRVFVKVKDQMPDFEFNLDCNKTPPLLLIRFRHENPITGQVLWAYPQPPLNFTFKGGFEESAMKTEDFTAGVKELISQANVTNIIDYIRNRANQRNQILYASQEGYPLVTGDIEKVLAQYQKNVFSILRVYFFVDPYPEKQLFVQQAIYAFLKMLNLIPMEYDF